MVSWTTLIMIPITRLIHPLLPLEELQVLTAPLGRFYASLQPVHLGGQHQHPTEFRTR